MSTLLVLQDSHRRPELFNWFGPIAAPRLSNCLKEHGFDACPAELFLLWERTGGGNLFESETILGPFGDPALGDGLVPTNRALHSRVVEVDLFAAEPPLAGE
jgi:hypothetical protein